MKKYITVAALLAAGTALTMAVNCEGDYVVNENTSRDTGIEFVYNAGVLEHTLKTETANAEIWAVGGVGLDTAEASLTFDILGTLSIRDKTQLPNASDAEVYVNTSLTAVELEAFESGTDVSRWLITTDYVKFFSTDKVDLSVKNADGLLDGGWVISYNNAYYSFDSATVNSDGYVNLSSTANSISLADGYVYSVAQITATGTGASVKGIGFVATAIPEPSTFGLLAGLGALALVGTRRRRK